jgi:hypothetical protein
MNLRTLSLAAATALSAAAIVPTAGAADAGAAPVLRLEGAYAYVQHIRASHQVFVRVVFRTGADLPRRYDGLIRAGGAIEGVGHSVATARRGTRCYAVAGEIKGGRIPVLGADGTLSHKRATLGARYRFELATKDGQSASGTLKLRAARPGDDSGRPLGC